MKFFKIAGALFVVVGGCLAIPSIPSESSLIGIGGVLVLVGIIFIVTAVRRGEI